MRRQEHNLLLERFWFVAFVSSVCSVMILDLPLWCDVVLTGVALVVAILKPLRRD
jgi:hypothetical protein